MKMFTLFLVFPLFLSAAECSKLEASFANLDAQFRMARTIQSPTKRYDYYYRYISAGAELMAYCRNDQRNYKYAEIVRKLQLAERERTGLRQSVIEEQWKVNDVKPIIKTVYRDCSYSY
jgi:hypothetical protein